MAEQRPMFRFRLPWMNAPAPPAPVLTPQNEAPSTTSTEPNVEPMVPVQRPFRLQRVAPGPQAPPLGSPKISAAPETKPQSQNSYQPTLPSKTQTQIDSQLPSPSLSSPQYSATSQLPSPSFTTPLFSSASQLPSPQSSTATSQSPSPWQIPSQEQDINSQLPSPKTAPRPSSPISSPEPSSTQAREPSQTSLTATNVQPIASPETRLPNVHEEPKQKTMNEATTSKHGNLVGKQTKSMKPTINKSTVRDSRKKVNLLGGDRVSFQEEIRSDISKLIDKMATANPENFKDEKGSIVALVGKNKGASMKLGFDLVRRGGELKLDDENSKEDPMTKAVINNNVQDINNSILMNSFIAERNPGVHLALHYDATELIMSYDKKGSPEARKGTSSLPLPKSPTSLPPEGDP